jgi:saccharopine dehydrogenase (NAD+, L-lysine-forming)
MKHIYIRRESVDNERRTPIVPKDIKNLVSAGITVVVQYSDNRIYRDEEYEKEGAILTNKPWYSEEYSNYLIIGLKELDHIEHLHNHTHMYFSHSFKNQTNAKKILDAFSKSNSSIYDFEYFLDNNKRYIAFGHYAGIVGAVLGLQQYTSRNNNIQDINNLKSYSSYSSLIKTVSFSTVKIALIGSEGRCASGVKKILDTLGMIYTPFTKSDSISGLENYDIVYNCIVLDEFYSHIWFDKTTHFTKPIVIVDISCDYSKKNNPIKLYTQATTWEHPVFKYNEFVDIIAIDNLPSLLPKESSDEFSYLCTKLLLSFGTEIWIKCLEKFKVATENEILIRAVQILN